MFPKKPPKPRYPNRKVAAKDKVTCLICDKVISLAQNLKKHLKNHSDFLDFRCNKYSISRDTALQNTLDNHMLHNDPMPMELLSNFKESKQSRLGSIFKYMNVEKNVTHDRETIEKPCSDASNKTTASGVHDSSDRTAASGSFGLSYTATQSGKHKSSHAIHTTTVCDVWDTSDTAKASDCFGPSNTGTLSDIHDSNTVTTENESKNIHDSNMTTTENESRDDGFIDRFPSVYNTTPSAAMYTTTITTTSTKTNTSVLPDCITSTGTSSTTYASTTMVSSSTNAPTSITHTHTSTSLFVEKVTSRNSGNTNMSSTSAKTQTLLKPISCNACNNMEAVYKFRQDTVKTFIDHCQFHLDNCSHKDKISCCCYQKKQLLLDNMFEKISPRSKKEENEEKTKSQNQEIFSQFIFKQDSRGDKIWFCSICFKHNQTLNQGNKKQDWHCKGSKFIEHHRLLDGMKKHVNTKKHKQMVDKSNISKGRLYGDHGEIAKRCTENLCIAGQFQCTHNLSQRFHENNCLFIHTINENLGSEAKATVHPLGNIHHGKMGIKEAEIACFKAVQQQMKKDDMEIFPPTGLLPRYMLSFDKGTASKDSQRQPIVMTKVNYKTGLTKEYLITASVLPHGTAAGAFKHVTEEASKIITTKRIAFTSSDNEPVYDGSKSGVAVKMQEDKDNYNKIIHLQDVCHNVERLMFPAQSPKEEQWVLDTINKSRQIIGYILAHPHITKLLSDYAAENIEEGIKFHTFRQHMKCRFSEYGSASFNSLLKNMNVMLKALPDIASESSSYNGVTKDVAMSMLRIIVDPVFLARIFLLDKVFVPVSKLQKQAQSVQFGPFDFIRIKEELKNSLEDSKKHDLNAVKQLVDKGIFEFTYTFQKKKETVKIDLNSINIPGHPSRSVHITGQSCLDQYNKWIENLLSRTDEYLGVPDAMQHTIAAFSVCDTELTDSYFAKKISNLRDLFKLVNTEFQNCGPQCSGVEKCDCIKQEFERFWAHVNSIKKNCIKKEEVDYTQLYKFYLWEKNFHVVKELKITNIVRAIEVFVLMKSSQSGTERSVSQIKRTVRGRFESDYRFGKVIENDMVNINVFLRENSSISSIDSKLAAKIFTEDLGHKESLKRSKPLSDISVTLKRMRKQASSNATKTKPRPKLNPVSLVEPDPGTKITRKSKDVPFDPNNEPDDPGYHDGDTQDIVGNENFGETHRNSKDTKVEDGDKSSYICSNLNKRKLEDLYYKEEIKETKFKKFVDENYFYERNSEVAKQQKRKNKSDELYDNLPGKVCIDSCKIPITEETVFGGWKWWGCKYKNKCASRLRRLQEGFKDGDWFHDNCLGKKYRKNSHLVCNLCSEENIRKKKVKQTDLSKFVQKQVNVNVKQTDLQVDKVYTKEDAREQLTKELKKELRRLYVVLGDGDCLFSTISVLLYGNPTQHANIRLRMADILEKIFKRFTGRWSLKTKPYGDELADKEAYFVSQVVEFHRYLIHKDCEDSGEITEDQMQAYINKKKTSCWETNDILNKEKWGNSIDLHLLGLMENRNVYVLRQMINKDNYITGYVLEHQVSYECRSYVSHVEDIKRNYYIVLYEHVGEHYSPIIPIHGKEPPRPVCRKVYLNPQKQDCMGCTEEKIYMTLPKRKEKKRELTKLQPQPSSITVEDTSIEQESQPKSEPGTTNKEDMDSQQEHHQPRPGTSDHDEFVSFDKHIFSKSCSSDDEDLANI